MKAIKQYKNAPSNDEALGPFLPSRAQAIKSIEKLAFWFDDFSHDPQQDAPKSLSFPWPYNKSSSTIATALSASVAPVKPSFSDGPDLDWRVCLDWLEESWVDCVWSAPFTLLVKMGLIDRLPAALDPKTGLTGWRLLPLATRLSPR